MSRPSHVRDSVRQVLVQSGRHDWSLDELHRAVLDRGVSAAYSSVFRAVIHLQRDGTLVAQPDESGRGRYELGGLHHDHVRCQRCGTVAAVEACEVESSEPRVAASTGFAITGHRLMFTGLCPACR